jgi:predicted PhzF superfamily epimerase YddE/YHI9
MALTFQLRYTPAHEVTLCGHATLATAHVLASRSKTADVHKFTFNTMSGALVAQRMEDGTFELDFPADDLGVVEDGIEKAKIEDAVHAAVAGKARVVGVHRGRFDLIVELKMNGEVRLQDLDIDFAAIVSFPRVRTIARLLSFV